MRRGEFYSVLSDDLGPIAGSVVRVQRLLALVSRARRSFRGSLSARVAAVIAVAVMAGATAGVMPAVVGRAVAAVSGVKDQVRGGKLAHFLGWAMPSAPWAIVIATLAVTVLVVAVAVASSKLGSALAGDLTAAMRIELMGAVVDASARAVSEAGALPTRPRLPGGVATPEVAAPEAQRAAVVQLAVAREAALVSEFAVSLLTSLPQAVATLLVLAVELVTGGSWVVLLGGGVLFGMSRWVAERASRRVADARRGLQHADAGVFGMLQETLGSLEDLRLWGARGQAVSEFAARAYECADARRRFSAAMATAGQVKNVFSAMSPLLVVVALQLGGRAMDAGGVANLLLLVPLLLGRLDVLDGVRQALIEREPLVDATLNLLALEAAPARAADAVTVDGAALGGELVFEDVTFTPPGASRAIIDGLSLRIPAGSVVGVCGASGSGKSTLLRLVLRLDDPQRGRILLDGLDVRTIEPSQLPGLFGVLRQSAQLLERPVRANLTIGLCEPPSDETLRAMLAQVELDSFALKDGPRSLDTVVRKSPPNVSGGEGRRLLLARMLLGNARVQLLDEPEAGLPSATAEALLESLVRAASGRTNVVVTHAPQLLRSDFNVVLRDGKVVATGTHDELVASSEEYRGLLADAMKAQRSTV